MTSSNTNAVAKVAAVVAGLGLVAMSFASFAPAKAATDAEMQAQIAQLLATIASLQAQMGGSSASAAFTMDLTIGSSGAEVTALQNWLISKGYSIPAGATGYFGAQTQAALAAYQAANGISPASGYFGPITRAKVNATAGGSTGSTGGSTGGSNNGGLSGGAGSVDDYTLISSLNNEEVGEDEEDVEVAGLEVEADEGSDLEITAVRVMFEEGATSNSKFDDYATEVSIWVDGEEFGRVDADEFDDEDADSDNSLDYTKTISLDSGAVIEAGDTGEITVAVSGISNLDSTDAGDTFTVDFTSVRFQDADDATISEDPSTSARSFSFTTFASASDAELKVSLTDGDDADDINEGHVVDIDDNDDTDDVEVLAFTFEVKGDSNLNVDSIPVAFTSAEASNGTFDDVDDIASGASLWLDGDVIASENFVSTDANDDAETITFDDLDLDLDAGEEYDFTVTVDVFSTADAIDNGDSISASIGSTERGNIDVEDESGEELVSGDRTGSAAADAVGLFDAGIMAEFVSAEEDVVSPDTGADRGTFTITFDVTAFDTDVYVDSTAIADETGGATYQNIEVAGAAGTGVIDSGADEGTDGFLVEEGQTERFTVTVNATGADSFASAALESILYATSDVDGDTLYAFDMSDYKTDSVYLSNNA